MNDLDLVMYDNQIYIYLYIDQCNIVFQFSQECLYKYRTAQYTLGEKDREKMYLSTDVYWHCESSKDYFIVYMIVL